MDDRRQGTGIQRKTRTYQRGQVQGGGCGVQFAVPADANLSGTTDFNDFLTLQNNYGKPGTWSNGDANYDGVIDFNDFLILQNNYGHAMPATAPMAAAVSAAARSTAPVVASCVML